MYICIYVYMYICIYVNMLPSEEGTTQKILQTFDRKPKARIWP